MADLVKFECEPAPLLLGFVLGPMLEEHLRRAMIIARDAQALRKRPPLEPHGSARGALEVH
jgi:putative tricarboxylic transport membrane protein